MWVLFIVRQLNFITRLIHIVTEIADPKSSKNFIMVRSRNSTLKKKTLNCTENLKKLVWHTHTQKIGSKNRAQVNLTYIYSAITSISKDFSKIRVLLLNEKSEYRPPFFKVFIIGHKKS